MHWFGRKKNAAKGQVLEPVIVGSATTPARSRRPAILIAILAASFLSYQYAKKLGVIGKPQPVNPAIAEVAKGAAGPRAGTSDIEVTVLQQANTQSQAPEVAGSESPDKLAAADAKKLPTTAIIDVTDHVRGESRPSTQAPQVTGAQPVAQPAQAAQPAAAQPAFQKPTQGPVADAVKEAPRAPSIVESSVKPEPIAAKSREIRRIATVARRPLPDSLPEGEETRPIARAKSTATADPWSDATRIF